VIQNVLHTLAYASDPVAIEVVKRFDLTEPSFVLRRLLRVSGSQAIQVLQDCSLPPSPVADGSTRLIRSRSPIERGVFVLIGPPS